MLRRVLEHFLDIVADHPADGGVKLEIFALMNATVTALARNALAATNASEAAQAAYLVHVAAAGAHPRISDVVSTKLSGSRDVDARRQAAMKAVLSGLLAIDSSTPRQLYKVDGLSGGAVNAVPQLRGVLFATHVKQSAPHSPNRPDAVRLFVSQELWLHSKRFRSRRRRAADDTLSMAVR